MCQKVGRVGPSGGEWGEWGEWGAARANEKEGGQMWRRLFWVTNRDDEGLPYGADFAKHLLEVLCSALAAGGGG